MLIEEIVKLPSYDSSNQGKKKFTQEISQEVNRLLQANEEKHSRGLHKQVMKKIDILEHLQDLGYNIGYTTVCHYINQKLHTRKEAFIRQVYSPGDVCEFDWGEVKLEIGGKLQTLYMAVFTPAMSNYRYALLFHRQDTAAFLQAHALFFEHIGGVFHTMVYDNMRVAIRKFVGLLEKEPTEALLKLSTYYQFHFRFCNIASGNEKGHERRTLKRLDRKLHSCIYALDAIDHLVFAFTRAGHHRLQLTIQMHGVLNMADTLRIDDPHFRKRQVKFICGYFLDFKIHWLRFFLSVNVGG